MNSVISIPSWGETASSRGRRLTKVLFLFIVMSIVLQISQCFVPHSLRTSTSSPHTVVTSRLRLQQQLTQIDPIKNNEGGEIKIGKTLRNTNNNTEHYGTLHPRKDDVEYIGDIFPRSPSFKLSKQAIKSTVDDMLQPSTRMSMGLFGESIHEESMDCINEREVLAKSSSSLVTTATPMDDTEIANLRLSVFSNFNPESRKLFCERSCQLLSSRRRRGATCVIATIEKDRNDNEEQTTKTEREDKLASIIGTAEISFHEFAGTKLSYSRPKDSILYVTEVAVDANQRRKGIAKLMMEAIDTLANSREVETIYLHVDVANEGAVNLYERAGYRKLSNKNPVFLEFTTKLNLHDGATKGRNHYLMAKDLRQPTWFNIHEENQQHIDKLDTARSQQRTLGIDVMSTV